MKYVCVAIVLFLLVLTASSAVLKDEDQQPSIRDLRRDIFRNYDKLVRPVKKPSTSVPLEMSMTPLQITRVDEYSQFIVLESWILMKWTDEYLKWDSNDYNTTILRLPSSEVWKPDLSLYTATAGGSFLPTSEAQVLVYNNGDVIWVPPYTLKSRCPMLSTKKKTAKNIIECNIKFGSWTYSENELNLQLKDKEVDLEVFSDIHPDWKLVHILADRQSKRYPCCPENYPSVNYNVTLRRRYAAFEGLNKKSF